MPNKPLKPCPGRGPRTRSCPNLIKGSETCCQECRSYAKQSDRDYDNMRGNSGERGYDRTWQKVRAFKTNRDPLCEICLKRGLTVPLDVVHHIQPIETHPRLRLVMENLMSLCNACHETIHKKGRWRRNER